MKTHPIRLILFYSFCLLLMFPVCSLSQTAKEYLDRGNSKFDIKDYSGAIVDFSKAIKLNPRYAMAFNNRGSAKQQLDDYDGAILDFDKAIEFNPQNATYYHNRAFAKAHLGNNRGARLDWLKAAELGDEKAFEYIREYFKIKIGITTTDEIKDFFSDLKSKLDPLEGIWLRHMKTRIYSKGDKVPKWDYGDDQILIIKRFDSFDCYHIFDHIGDKVSELFIYKSAGDNVYMYTYQWDKFFGCLSVDKSFRLINGNFEINYEIECRPKGFGDSDRMIIESYNSYERLFPQ